ncbi:SMP-30/gluconolactonase/LRE family protein [Dyadobacter fermentans]|uniref:Gluconolactonase n=1 Tax=Dyadobacter fermentans (strain ATCC 700827 / DSM 18053 / CIP 107007 / KCTC 52180 / NS114) TaxID=471854 RepID=C6W0N8_DYAFD|nr:SMP-30/gluconolactonase/LRE family protein [Dyadobacter fermentans]ACT93644.1 Gluconolactonase [Dyadobacter fermentans DSM 18053]
MAQKSYPTMGKIVYEDPSFEKLLSKDAKIEVLASGFEWSEGPVWVKDGGYLLFSDVPKNKVYKWDEKEGLSVFLEPSGYTGRGVYSDEPGSNGLIIDNKGRLVSCEHGDRRISAMPLQVGGKITLADHFEGKRFNSPNDVVQHSNGDYYFTDPPYGLAKKHEDPTREISQFGVYRIHKDGKVTMQVSDLSRPNGLAFSPDGKTLYVAQSDPEKSIWMAYPMDANGNAGKGKLIYDATPMGKKGIPGLPDGLKIDKDGNLWSSGPGGMLIISPAGKLLGRIEMGELTSNCAWGNDGSTLYMTVDGYVCRIKTNTKGVGW